MPLEIYYNTNDDANAGNVFAANWKGQTFTTVGAFTIASVKLKLYRVVGSPGDLTCSIRATDGDGKPTGADLASVTQSGNGITTDSGGEWVTFTFSVPYALSATTKYAIVLRAPSGDASNYIGWRGDTTSPTYADGSYTNSTDSGATWALATTDDFMFETWSAAAATVKSQHNLLLMGVA